MKLKSKNHPEIEHEFTMVIRDNEIIFALPNGKEICNIKAETMGEKLAPGKWETCPTKNFWLVFDHDESSTRGHPAAAWVEPRTQ